MTSQNHFQSDSAAHKTQLRTGIERRVEHARKTMQGAFFLGLVVGSVAALALLVTWLSTHAGTH